MFNQHISQKSIHINKNYNYNNYTGRYFYFDTFLLLQIVIHVLTNTLPQQKTHGNKYIFSIFSLKIMSI